jgi:hypothetical protein
MPQRPQRSNNFWRRSRRFRQSSRKCKPMANKKDGGKRRGQAMLIAVLAIGGAILGATAIAGFLTLYELRSGNDTQNSAKAIFAADSGVEYALFNYYCPTEGRCASAPPFPTFANGATDNVTCYDATGVPLGSCFDPAVNTAISKGLSLNSSRAFLIDLTAQPIPPPTPAPAPAPAPSPSPSPSPTPSGPPGPGNPPGIPTPP